jgi:hypothetical protein
MQPFNPGLTPDDAHTIRDEAAVTFVTIGGRSVPVSHPKGYRLISLAESEKLGRDAEAAINRERDNKSNEVSKLKHLIFEQTEIAASQQRRIRNLLTQHREIRQELRQARFALYWPLRWIYLTLIGKAITADEKARAERFNELTEGDIIAKPTR